ncbi:hypothetical protein FSY45_22530 [Comamonas sp. Z1]|uniref:hypothetical protein n=1 Tax=Comamonas TaxID=283 RepID=UPI0006995BF7|nr:MULTISPECIES: hypothetical protein [Comamonas]TYK72100.1 hypothetical protein FSY45_22530 [Comamonas sp. Z1]BCX53877.1 hypothetical protein CTYAZ2_34570 [Comamonas testosteroni]
MNEAQKLLAAAFAGELDLDADASGSSGVSAPEGSATSANSESTQAATAAAAGAEAATTATTAGTAAAASAQEEHEGAPIASKSGGYTIPYEKLTEARTARDSAIAEAAQLRAQLEQMTAAQAANLQQAQAEAQARADAGKAPTQADQNLAAATSLVQGGTDASLFGDFSEEGIASGIEKLVAARVEAALAPQREAQARDQAVSAEQAHTQKILDAHKDAFEVAESKEFASWKSGQPGYVQAAIDRTLQAGSAQDVIDLLGQFKQVHANAAGAATADPTAAAVAKALADAKTAPPVSLSSLPGAAAAGATEAERVMELAGDPAALMAYMQSLPPERQMRLMNSVV